MQKLFFILLIFSSIGGNCQAPGVVDAHVVSEQHMLFAGTFLDIGDDLWDDMRNFYSRKKLKLKAEEEDYFKYGVIHDDYPYPFGLPYLNLYHESDHWALRVFKTIDLKTANNQLFSLGAQNVRWTRESDRSVTADTFRNELNASLFLDQIGLAIYHDLTLYSQKWFDYIAADDPKRDSLMKRLYDANKIIIKEDYFYKPYTGELESQIIGLGLAQEDEEGQMHELMWMYFPELRYYIDGQPFTHFNHKLNWKYTMTYRNLFEEHLFDIESIETVPYTINLMANSINPPKEPYTTYSTDFNALYHIAMIKEHLRKDYKEFTGVITDKIAENYNVVGNLEKGIMQGEWSLLYDSGAKRVTLNFQNNTPHGSYQSYWPNGNLFESGSFEFGLRSGEWNAFFENKKKLSKKHYLNGWMDGVQEIWYANGKQHMSYTYSNGMLNGEFFRKNQKGKFIEQGYFTDDLIDKTWQINLLIPEAFINIIERNADLDWKIPLEAFKDGVLSYTVELEQGDFKTNCPSPVFDCVRMVERSEIK